MIYLKDIRNTSPFLLHTPTSICRLFLLMVILVVSGCGSDSDLDVAGNPTPTLKFTSNTNTSVNEKTDGVIYTATATDDGDTLSLSISGGADQAAFSIDSATGELSLTSAADFEAPSDANADNVFEVTLEVSDSNGESDQLNLLLTINNVNEVTKSPSATRAQLIFKRLAMEMQIKSLK
jgi:hypothetical protein